MVALVLVSAALLVLGVLAYRRTISDFRFQIADSGNRGRDEVGGLGLLILRVIVLLLFASVFVGAVFTRAWVERPRRVAVMLDASQSMSAVGAESAAAEVAQVLPIPVGVERQKWVFADTAEAKSQKAKAKKLLRDLLAYAQKLQKTPARIDYFATSLPTLLLFEDDLQSRQETGALFLQAQARLGLAEDDRAKVLLQTVLKRDPNHALAADLVGELADSTRILHKPS